MKKPKASKLRIGRGRLGGRYVRFREYQDLRPTLGRVKDAVFAMIAEQAPDYGFMDLFAGSGIMAFEAESIGFSPVWLCEPENEIINEIKANIEELDAAVHLVHASCFHLHRHNPPPGRWIIYADPPFSDKRLQTRTQNLVRRADFFQPGSLYVAETELKPDHVGKGFELINQKRYGRVHITIMEKLEGAEKVADAPLDQEE